MEEINMITTGNGKAIEKKRKFVDMDNVLVDFQSGLDLQSLLGKNGNVSHR